MRIKLIANNISWLSLQNRVNALKEKLSGLYSSIYNDIDITIVNTGFTIPLPDVNGDLPAAWFEKNIPLDAGFDAYVLLINRSKDWKATHGTSADIILGQYIQSGDTLNFYIVTDEWNTTVQNDLKTYYVFEDTFEHELAHAVYHDLKCPLKSFMSDQVYRYGSDNVHYYAYADRHNFAGIYQDIYKIDKQNFPGLSPNLTNISLTITSLIKSFTTKFSQPMQTSSTTSISSSKDYITLWAKAAQDREGYFVNAEYPQGTPAYKNCNPGNIEYGPYAMQLGATGANGRFAIFANYQAGFNALCQFFKDACQGHLISYKPTMTMYDFYAVYAPSGDNNDPSSYANQVIKALDIDPTRKIGTLI